MITHSKASKRKDAAAADARTWMGPHTSIYILLAATAGHWLVQKNARYVTFVGAGVLGGPGEEWKGSRRGRGAGMWAVSRRRRRRGETQGHVPPGRAGAPHRP